MTDATTSAAALAARLDAARQELLDLGLRNPLLNFRPSASRGVGVMRESTAAVYDVLVGQGKTMYFQAAREASDKPTETTQPARPTGSKLQTDEALARLERRLLSTHYTARTSLEEQDMNILYLALGMLTWYEADSSAEPRRAPLVLVPVVLERGPAAERFRLRYSGAEVEGNLSLQARLQTSFGLALPMPEPDEDLAPADYCAAVAAAVADFPRWQVAADRMELGFFSFGKFRLYRDLDPASWPAGHGLLGHPAVGALLGAEAGFRDAPPTVGDTAFLDTKSPAAALHQVLDADSSQLLALLAVHEGRNLVIQGPPGTGKSQTIANLLAEAIGAGKTVLFVAEKMTALEVVKRRLDALGLGAACLELHSHKANKKALLDELRSTLSLGRPATAPPYQLAQLPTVIRQKEIHQYPAGHLAAWVAEVVAVESPVHADEVTRRLALAAGATQVGARIRASVAAAIRVAGQLGSIRPQGDFLWTPTMRPGAVPVRDRSALPAASRRLSLIAPEERTAAVLAVVSGSFSLEKSATPTAAARLLGFARPSEEQRQVLAAVVEQLLKENRLRETNNTLTMV